MAVNLSPVGGVAAQFFDNSGNVLTGGKLYTYLAGTTTPAVTYTTSAGNVPWSNPIILDAAGRVSGSGEIWLVDASQYKFILRDNNDVLIATYDNINGINSNFVAFTNQQEIQTATAGQTVFNLSTVQYQPGTNSLSVFVDGVNQYGPGAQYAYIETDADTVTFVNGLHVGALVKFTTSQLNSSGASVDAQQVSYTPPFTNSVATNVEVKLSQYVSVEDFGAAGDGVADDTIAFQNAAAYIRSINGGTLSLGNGKTYLVYPTSVSHTSKLLDLTNCDGVAIEGNGATILCGADAIVRNAIYLSNTSNVTVRNLNFESQLNSLTSGAGMYWIVAETASKNILLENLDFQYGTVGFQAVAAGTVADVNRVTDIVALNLSFLTCYYPLNFQFTGDNFFGRNIYTRNCGRSYFPYNVKNHDLWLDSQQGGPFSDVLLKVYVDPTFSYNRLENIKLNYFSSGRYAGSGNQGAEEAMIAMDYQQNSASTAAGFIQNIDIQFNVEPSGVNQNRSIFIVRKYTSSGAPDPTGRGHQLVNFNIHGVGRSLQNLLSDYIIFFNRAGENWAGDVAYNVSVTNASLAGLSSQNAITINGAPISASYGQCVINNVSATGNLNRIGTNGTLFGVINSVFNGYFSGSEPPQPFTTSWTGSVTNPAIGDGSLTAFYTLENKICTVQIKMLAGSTTTFGSGTWAFSLPFGISNDVEQAVGSALALDTGVNFYTGISLINAGQSTVVAYLGGTTGNIISATNPFTWASGDYVYIQISYPVA
jgi:hypothetical protein